MAFGFNGATHIINRSDAILQSWPITLHGRIRLTNPGDGLDHTIIGLWESGSNNGFRLQVEAPGGLTKARCGTKAGGTASNATTSTTITDTNWHSVVGEITAANARQVWLDNGGNGSSTTSLTPGTLTKTTVGAFDNGGTLGGNVAHELADVAVWSGTLTADERAALAAGVSPLLIRPDILEIYLPLMRGGNDYMGGVFTVTGASAVDHPRVYMPGRFAIAKKLVSAYNVAISVTNAPSISLARAAGLARSITSSAGSTISLATLKAKGVAISVTNAPAFGMVRGIALGRLITNAPGASLARGTSLARTIAASAASSVALARAKALQATVSVTLAPSVALATLKAKGVLISVTNAPAMSLTQLRAFGRSISVAGTTVVSMLRPANLKRTLSFTSAASVLLSWLRPDAGIGASRILRIPAEIRRLVIKAEVRTVTIEPENRRVVVKSEKN